MGQLTPGDAMHTHRALEVGVATSCDITVTVDHIDACVRLSHDTNPLHLDDEAARAFGFPGAVAHGLFALGMISRLIGTQLPGPGALWLSHDVRFVSPVLVGDELTARVEVQQVSKAAATVVLKTEVINRTSGTQTLVGIAKVKMLERRNAADARSVAR